MTAEELIDALKAEASKIPIGQEDCSRGQSTYNWWMRVIRRAERIVAEHTQATYPLTRAEVLAVSNKQYTLDGFSEWAKNLAHINPTFVDTFVEQHRDSRAITRTPVEWMDMWSTFWEGAHQ